MIGLLVTLLVLVVILGIAWVIISRVPIPPDLKWIVDIVFLIIALICIIAVLTGYWSFPVHPVLR